MRIRLTHVSYLFTLGIVLVLLMGSTPVRAQCPMDADGDGHISAACGGDDCNDSNAAVYPGATEIPGDGVDENCDGLELCYQDQDGDGWGSAVLVSSFSLLCSLPNQARQTGDCDDGDPTIYPGAYDIPGDGIDQNCDGADAAPVPAPRSSWGMLKGKF